MQRRSLALPTLAPSPERHRACKRASLHCVSDVASSCVWASGPSVEPAVQAAHGQIVQVHHQQQHPRAHAVMRMYLCCARLIAGTRCGGTQGANRRRGHTGPPHAVSLTPIRACSGARGAPQSRGCVRGPRAAASGAHGAGGRVCQAESVRPGGAEEPGALCPHLEGDATSYMCLLSNTDSCPSYNGVPKTTCTPLLHAGGGAADRAASAASGWRRGAHRAAAGLLERRGERRTWLCAASA